MKIVFIAGFAWEPKGTVRARAFPLGRALVRAGHQVRILIVPYDNLTHSGITRIKDGVELVNVRVGRPGISWLGALRQLWSELKAFDPDVVHVFKPKGFAGLAGTLLHWSGAKNWVLDCDDWEGWGGWNDVLHRPYLVQWWIDWQERWLIRQAPVVTVASRILERRSCQLRSGNHEVAYVPNCAAETFADLSAEPNSESPTFSRTSEAVQVFYAGHYEPGDGLDFVAEVAKACGRDPRVHFNFIGDGPLMPWLRDQIDAATATFWGRQSLPRYWRLLSEADIAIFPYPDNVIYRSKCSARIIDFMQAGKPIVTTALGQNEEYLEDGKNALLVGPGQVSEFVAAINKLADSPAMRQALGEAARTKAAQYFNWGVNAVPRVLTAYSQVCSQAHPLSAETAR